MEAPSDDRCEIWPDQADAVALFLSMESQWRWTGAGMAGAFRTGLDYSALPVVAEAIGVKPSPEIIADLRIMEGEAVAVWARRAK
ncbi:MAG TPA: DUF1799 domain-containing protein [Allosphingosinicella sp.]|nr:DUF1799 domain-containing protein [Allosphingosinicella sp.]